MRTFLTRPRACALAALAALALPFVSLDAQTASAAVVAPKLVATDSPWLPTSMPAGSDPAQLVAGYGLVVGRVTDTTGAGLPFSTIGVAPTSPDDAHDWDGVGMTTSADGTYTYALPVGTYTLTVFPGNTYTTTNAMPQVITVVDRQQVAQDFDKAFTRTGGLLLGTVTDVNNKPVPGVVLLITNTDKSESYPETTDYTGSYGLTFPLGAAFVSISTFPAGYGTGNTALLTPVSIALSPTTTTTYNFTGITVPATTGSVWGTLLDTTGKPVVGAGISFTANAGGATLATTTDATGSYSIVTVPGAGVVSIVSTPAGWVRTSTYTSIAATVYLGRKYERSFPKAFAPSKTTGVTPTPVPTPAKTAVSTPVSLPAPSATPTSVPTVKPTATPTPTPKPTATPKPTTTPTTAPTATVATKTVQGTVTDQFGNVVAGVRLTLTTTTTAGKVSTVATTNAAGVYSVKVAVGDTSVAVTTAPKGYTVSKAFGTAQSASPVGAVFVASFFKGVTRAASAA